MSTHEEPRATEPAETTESTESPDVAAAPTSDDGSGAASADTLAELRDIEAEPLSERATGYQQLADRLRAELEHSDPSRGPS